MQMVMSESTELSEACLLDDDSHTSRRIRRSLLILALALLSPLVMSATASFTATTDNPGNSFQSGTLHLGIAPSTTILTMTTMAPGDAITGPVTVSNTGGLQLRYAVTSTTTEDALAAQLVLKVKSGLTAGTCTTGNMATGDVYSGVLGTVAGTAIAGSTTQGAQLGDRTVNSGASELLCFSVSYPATITSRAAASTTATFAFVAEQVANNP
jgi:hypothetical protein